VKIKMATLTPAYGRDYKSKKSALEDFNNNKDFMINCPFTGSMPTNKADLIKLGELYHTIRYSKLRKVITVKI
jgi:hypothetical protein